MKSANPYIIDILSSIQKVQEYLKNIQNNKQSFEANTQIQDAIIRRLEIIGEATKKLEHGFKESYPHIPWRKMAGTRDILIHNYDEVDLELIWKVIIEDLPALQSSLQIILKD